MVEGHSNLEIDHNIIFKNQKDGIVLLHSHGKIMNNQIEHNERHGLQLLSNTFCKIEGNKIQENK